MPNKSPEGMKVMEKRQQTLKQTAGHFSMLESQRLHHRMEFLVGDMESVGRTCSKKPGGRAINHGRRKGREEQSYCVMQLSGREVSGTQEQEGVGLATGVENTGRGLENENEAVGNTRENEREEVRCEVFHGQEEPRHSE